MSLLVLSSYISFNKQMKNFSGQQPMVSLLQIYAMIQNIRKEQLRYAAENTF